MSTRYLIMRYAIVFLPIALTLIVLLMRRRA